MWIRHSKRGCFTILSVGWEKCPQKIMLFDLFYNYILRLCCLGHNHTHSHGCGLVCDCGFIFCWVLVLMVIILGVTRPTPSPLPHPRPQEVPRINLCLQISNWQSPTPWGYEPHPPGYKHTHKVPFHIFRCNLGNTSHQYAATAGIPHFLRGNVN